MVDFGRNFTKLRFMAFEFGSVILFFRLNFDVNDGRVSVLVERWTIYIYSLTTFLVPHVNANDITALNLNGKESLWIDRGWRSTDTDKDSGLSEAKLLGNANNLPGNFTDAGTDYAEVDTRNMSTFYNCRKVRKRIAI